MDTARADRGFVGTFLRTLAFVMLCGIVGPIFLVLYFVIGDRSLQWMFWTGAAITVLNVLIAFAIAYGADNRREKIARMMATGRMALADLTSVEQTTVEINGQPLVKLGLRIHGDGVPTFDAQIRKTVPIVAQGLLHRRVLAVLVDPATREFEIDWQASALVAGSVPAQFSSAEDGRTYDLSGQPGPLIAILEVLRRHGIATDGTVDLRNGDPYLRQEVMGIVRQYGRQPGAAATDGRSLTERLDELDALRAAGRISEPEYGEARRRLLGTT